MREFRPLPFFAPNPENRYYTQTITFIGTIIGFKANEKSKELTSIGIYGKRIGGETDHQILVAKFFPKDENGNPSFDPWYSWLSDRVGKNVVADFGLSEGSKPMSNGVNFIVQMDEKRKDTAYFPIKIILPF
jgi:hypothetical protein